VIHSAVGNVDLPIIANDSKQADAVGLRFAPLSPEGRGE
jgi:hypothetical protein